MTTKDQTSEALYEIYRPKTLDEVLGNEKAVTRLKGILKSGKWPSSLMIVGPTSAGKTTLARAFAGDCLGTPIGVSGNARNYMEINAGANGKVDEIREMLKVSRLQPVMARKRFVVIDEAQNLTGASEQAVLKPFENSPPSTLYITCSMEPEKIHQALKNRASMFVLAPPEKIHLTKYANRIIKGEELSYVGKEVRDTIVENSNGEYRTCANIIESMVQYVSGLEKTPTKLTPELVEEIFESIQTNDEMLAVRVMLAVYMRKFKKVHRDLMDVQEPFRFINRLLYLNTFMLGAACLAQGDKHKTVWWSKPNIELNDGFKEHVKVEGDDKLMMFGIVGQYLTEMKAKSSGFMVPELNLMSATLFQCIDTLKKRFK